MENSKSESVSHVLTFCGKPPEKMSWKECKNEIRIQRWFARRCDRLSWAVGYGNECRRKELEEGKKLKEAEEAFKRGEITELKLRQMRNGNKQSWTKLHRNEECDEFLKMHEYNALAIIDACQDRLRYVHPPKKPKKRFVPYKRGSRPFTKKRKLSMKNQAYLQRLAWARTLEKRPIGALWDKDKFFAICADRGYGSLISVTYFVAQELELTQYQISTLFEKGCFTWGQVLILGAALEMTPKEFCDTFLSGFFVEIAEGDFRAGFDNIPESLYPNDEQGGTDE